MSLFLRTGEIVVGQPQGDAVSIKDLRFEFDITKTASKTANQASLKIYNAAPSTITMLETINNFWGCFCRSLTYQDGPVSITEMELLDSVIPLRDAKISVSFPPNTSAMTVLDGVAKNFGLPIKKSISKVQDKQYVGGFAYNGRVRDAMDRVCNYLGLEWSAEDGEIQIIKKGGVYADTAVVLSKDTGMIG